MLQAPSTTVNVSTSTSTDTDPWEHSTLYSHSLLFNLIIYIKSYFSRVYDISMVLQNDNTNASTQCGLADR